MNSNNIVKINKYIYIYNIYNIYIYVYIYIYQKTTL